MLNNDVQSFFENLWAIRSEKGNWLSQDIVFLVKQHLDSSLNTEKTQDGMYIKNTDQMLIDFLEEKHLINRHDATTRLMALRQRPIPNPNDPKVKAVYQLFNDADISS